MFCAERGGREHSRSGTTGGNQELFWGKVELRGLSDISMEPHLGNFLSSLESRQKREVNRKIWENQPKDGICGHAHGEGHAGR